MKPIGFISAPIRPIRVIRVLFPFIGLLLASSLSVTAAPNAADDATQAEEQVASAVSRLQWMRLRADVEPAEVESIVNAASRATQSNRGQADGQGDATARSAEAAQRRFMQGRVLTLAAEVLPKESDLHKRYLTEAIERFKTLRLEHRAIRAGQLGYIGEATAQRIAGRLDRAERALQPVLGDKPNRRGDGQAMTRLALVEQAKIALARDPQQAGEVIERALSDPAFKDRPQWQARLRWIQAQADISGLRQRSDTEPDQTRIESIANSLRDKDLQQVTLDAERLQLLAHLDELTDARIMKPRERLDWADMLARLNRTEESQAVYRQVRQDHAETFTAADWRRLGELQHRAGRLQAAANAYARALEAPSLEIEMRVDLLQRRARLLEQALANVSQEAQSELRDPARRAWMNLVESPAPRSTQRHALQRWTWLTLQGSASFIDCREQLLTHESLTEGEPYLQYTLAMAEWKHLQRRRRENAIGEDEAADKLRSVIRTLESVETTNNTDQPSLAPHAVLGRARMFASPLLGESRQALSLLQSHWDALKANPDLAGHAAPLRARLLLEMGLTNKAYSALDDLSSNGTDHALLKRTLKAIAARYKGLGPTERDRVQSQVVNLAERVLAAASSQGPGYAETAYEIARPLMRVEAHRIAQDIAAAARKTASKNSEPKVRAGLLAIEVNALRLQQQLDEALKLLEAHANSFTDSIPLQMAKAHCYLDLDQPSKAIEPIRRVRNQSRAGTERWWRATLLLSRALKNTGKTQAADEVLRVAATLHPAQSPELQREIEALQSKMTQ